MEQVKALDVDVLLKTRIQDLATDKIPDTETDRLTGLQLESGETCSCEMVCFAVGITPRDELAESSGIEKHNRGGFLVKDDLSTSAPNVYAIGECASWNGETYGLIAPGVEMADILAFNLTEGFSHKMRSMTTPDLSTKLKLMGVNVASFGDYFADRKPATALTHPRRRKPADATAANGSATAESSMAIPGQVSNASGSTSANPNVRCLTYHDPFSNVYKKYIFTSDGKYLLGGMMIGDVNDYTKVVSIVKKKVRFP